MDLDDAPAMSTRFAMDGDDAPPSSPPLACTMDLAPHAFFERPHAAFTSKSSSPPPIFSSDDSRESVDVTNYESPRIHKNKRKGAWWDSRESAHASPEVKKTKFARNLDSGIYMLSDGTSSSDELPLPHYTSPYNMRSKMPVKRAVSTNHLDDQDMDADTASPPTAEHAFVRQMDHGIAWNQESYDFNGQSLEDSDIRHIGSLKTVISHPPVHDTELPTPGQYRSLLPRLHIHLSKNKLCRLVPSLFDLEHLTGLYLRQNEIEELPQQIRRLSKLETLDVSLNKLKSLPFDVITLLSPHGNMTRLTLTGKDLLQPMSSHRFSVTDYHKQEQGFLHHMDSLPLDEVRQDAASQLAHLYQTLATCTDRDQAVWRIRYFESWANSFDGGDDARECNVEQDVGFYPHHPSLPLDAIIDSQVLAHAPRFIARTLVAYYDQGGNLLRASPRLPRSNEEKYPIIIETNQGTYGVPSSPWFAPPSTSKTPSLVTASLYRALKSASIAIIRAFLDSDFLPVVEAILLRAEENAADGYGMFRSCHTCHKEYIVARAEWIEFWSRGGEFFPLKVSVCSWGCVPPGMVQRPQKELTW
ncbi:hypothetical protein G6011_01777 [Alternaria panax]|uniref:Uncharacterized protein n=1 Tax=Alternaria panax TaxID=48097 RepID=A0AAD4NUV7_9PLEO|nr:hypothetical protein G6011_01777 [Alternaria panax]